MIDIEEELGTHEICPEASAEIRKYFGLPNLEEIARVTLKRFPELQEGERISVREIKNRLREIKSMGYHVKPYSKMNRREAWNYLKEIRKDLSSKLKIYNPKVLLEIERDNEKAIEDYINIS